MPEKFENIPQAIERNERADYLVEFLNRINADRILSSEETKREFIKNIFFEDFKGWIVRVNGILRSIPIKERGLDGKDVALMPNPDQVNELERAFIGEKKPEYPPREADKEELLKEMFELAQNMEAQGVNLDDIALLFSAGINAIHPFEDGNGRTSRLLNYLVNTDYTGSKEQTDFLRKLLGDKGRLFINGGNTFLEMGFAHVLGKKIFCLNPLPEKLKIFYQELIAMQPVILNGTLKKIEGAEIKQCCDNKSVGILVWHNDRLLLIERKKFPFGFAPPAGHVDEHGSFEQAARNELKEEVDLDALDLKLIKEGKKDNPCRRGSTWHYWKIYQAETKGELKPSEEETKQAGWYSKDELKQLAKRTEDYLSGAIKEDEWQNNPGLEPVWYDWLKEIEII